MLLAGFISDTRCGAMNYFLTYQRQKNLSADSMSGILTAGWIKLEGGSTTLSPISNECTEPSGASSLPNSWLVIRRDRSQKSHCIVRFNLLEQPIDRTKTECGWASEPRTVGHTVYINRLIFCQNITDHGPQGLLQKFQCNPDITATPLLQVKTTQLCHQKKKTISWTLLHWHPMKPKSDNQKVFCQHLWSVHGHQTSNKLPIRTVRVGFCLWAFESARVMKKIPHFGVGIVWGAIPSGLPVFRISVSGRSWNSYGTSAIFWVQKNSSSFDKAPKIRDSVLLNSLESFLVTLPSISSETSEM